MFSFFNKFLPKLKVIATLFTLLATIVLNIYEAIGQAAQKQEPLQPEPQSV
jgi:hypothetical protein